MKMTEYQEDEEIACNNMFKRGIEDAIRESRAISFSEFDAFRSAVGALVPKFLVRSIPQLLFMNPVDAMKASRDSIDFIKNHPSLPVSFDVNGSVQLLLSHYHKLETFTTLQSIDSEYFTTDEWRNFMSIPLGATAKDLASSGRVQCLHALIKGHFEELRGSVDLVGDLIAKCPINPSSEPFLISLLRSCIVPGLNDLVDLSQTLVNRARHLGTLNEPQLALELLDTVLNVEVKDSATPLEQVRATILTSGREEVSSICDAIKQTLSTMCLAFGEFEVSLNFDALESNRMATLESVATDLLVSTGNMDAFTRFCALFSVNRDALLAVQVMRVKEQILSNDKRPRFEDDQRNPSPVSVDSLVEVLYSLVHEISDLETKRDCIYAALTAVDSLNGLSREKERFTQLARSLVTDEGSSSLLSLYLSVQSVQNLLIGYPQFQAPDFLLRRENVLLAATELASLGELQIVEKLANVFPYIDLEEMKLIHLMTQFYSQKLPVRESISARFLEAVLEEPFNAFTLAILDSVDIPLHLQEDVRRLKILFLDFEKSESRSTLRKFDEYLMSDFESLLVEKEGRADKLERARLVFNLPRIDSVESLCDLQVNESMGRAEIQSVVSRVHELLESVQDPTEIVRLVDQVLVPAGRLLTGGVAADTADELDCLVVCSPEGSFESFEEIEKNVRLHAFSAQLRPLIKAPKLDSEFTTDSSSSCGQDELLSRAQWGLEFERLGIRVPKDLLMEDIHDRKKIKKILTEYFPVWFVRSGMDVAKAKKFGSDFGRAETDILVKCLELILVQNDSWTREKGNCVLIQLLNNIDKIESFILPAIQGGEQLRWLVAELQAHGVVLTSEFERIKKISDMTARDDLLVSFGIQRSVRSVVDLLTESLRTGTVEWAVSLSRLAVDESILSDFTTELVRKICVCPELVGEVHHLLQLIELTLTAELREKALRQLLNAIPVSPDQLVIAKRFAEQFSGISEADLMLLENRLVLQKFGVTELNLSLKKLIEHILSNHEVIARYDELVDELVTLNGIDGVKLRFDLVKKWITDEDSKNLLGKVLAALGKLKHEKPLEIATCLLKLYFSADVEVERKIVAFDALFALVSKQVVMEVYNNSINDLVEIQKNLVYMHMLCNRVIKPLPYKDFVALDKALVAKTLLNAGKAEFAELASLVIADFAVCDFQIIEKLEERVKVLLDGAQATKILNNFQARMERMGIWYKPQRVHAGKHAQTVDQVANENVAMN